MLMMKRAHGLICLILALLAFTGCEPPTGPAGGPNDKDVTKEVVRLGVAGPASKLWLWSYAVMDYLQDPGYVRVEADLTANAMDYTHYCPNRNEVQDRIDIPSGVTDTLQDLFANQELCRLRFDIPRDHPVCMAMVLPLAEIKLANGEDLILNQEGTSICYQSLTYFCDPEAAKTFLEQLKALVDEAPPCP